MDTTPAETARETLKRLAARKLAPTPDNFTEVYEEISGHAQGGVDRSAVRMLQRLADDISGDGGAAAQLAHRIGEHDWAEVHKLLVGMLDKDHGGNAPDDAGEPGDWAKLVRALLRGLEARHSGWTTARKRESLERVLEASGGDTARLQERLGRLVQTWSEAPADSTGTQAGQPGANASSSTAEAAAALPVINANAEIPGLLREMVARTLRMAVIQRLGEPKDLFEGADQLAERLQRADSLSEINHCAAELKDFWFKFEARGREQDETLQGMLRLINLLMENVVELVSDDSWLKGQIGMMREMLSSPIDSAKLKDAERRFKDVLLKQGVMRQSMDDLKAALKGMLATFIDRLGALTESTGGFGARVEDYARQIRETDDLAQLDRLLRELMQETRVMQADVLRSRDELIETRRKVQDYEDRIRKLEAELSQVSGKIREDQLTQALNRRGLEETFDVELARCARKSLPLCVALLDIDNFKQLNDRYGHKAGDDALVHLVAVVRDTLRPSDSVARIGGEEFVILLPEAGVDEAAGIMRRVQRSLTRRFFLANNERLLITFSAGVALHDGAESRESVIARADQALYEAKRTGKNRVVTAGQDGPGQAAPARPDISEPH